MMASSAQVGTLLKLRLRGLLLKFPGEVPSLYFGLKEPMGLMAGRVKGDVARVEVKMGAAAVTVPVAKVSVLLLFSIDMGTVEVGVCINAMRFAAAAAAATAGWSFLRSRTA